MGERSVLLEYSVLMTGSPPVVFSAREKLQTQVEDLLFMRTVSRHHTGIDQVFRQ